MLGRINREDFGVVERPWLFAKPDRDSYSENANRGGRKPSSCTKLSTLLLCFSLSRDAYASVPPLSSVYDRVPL